MLLKHVLSTVILERVWPSHQGEAVGALEQSQGRHNKAIAGASQSHERGQHRAAHLCHKQTKGERQSSEVSQDQLGPSSRMQEGPQWPPGAAAASSPGRLGVKVFASHTDWDRWGSKPLRTPPTAHLGWNEMVEVGRQCIHDHLPHKQTHTHTLTHWSQ